MKTWHGIQAVKEKHRAQARIMKKAGGDIHKYAQVVREEVRKLDKKYHFKYADLSSVSGVAEERKKYE